jgi:DNA-binding NarL/FixJ family response regulator
MIICQDIAQQPELRVMIIDPSPFHCYGLECVLNASFNSSIKIVTKVSNLKQAMEVLELLQIDVIIGTPVSECLNIKDWQQFCLMAEKISPLTIYVLMIDLTTELLKLFTPESIQYRTIILKRKVPIENFCAIFPILKYKKLPVNLSLASRNSDLNTSNRLTKKESSLLIELMNGKNMQQISAVSGTSLSTLSGHKWNAMRKLGKKNSLQLMFLLHRQNALESEK